MTEIPYQMQTTVVREGPGDKNKGIIHLLDDLEPELNSVIREFLKEQDDKTLDSTKIYSFEVQGELEYSLNRIKSEGLSLVKRDNFNLQLTYMGEELQRYIKEIKQERAEKRYQKNLVIWACEADTKPKTRQNAIFLLDVLSELINQGYQSHKESLKIINEKLRIKQKADNIARKLDEKEDFHVLSRFGDSRSLVEELEKGDGNGFL